MLLFNEKDRPRVARGEITVTFRLWTRAHVRPGRAYATGFGTVLVEDVQVMPAALVSDDDVRLAGCRTREEVWALAGFHKSVAVTPDTLLHRVAFRYLGEAPPERGPVVALDPATAIERLQGLDRLSGHGPWTLAALRAIDGGPFVPARLLAASLGRETAPFKADVRKLKRLGLTRSHEVGYELTDLGRAVLATLEGAAAAR
jgi:hypothetical protein